MARRPRMDRLAASKAPAAFANDTDALIAFLDLERGLARNSRESYQRDLDQAAAFLAGKGAADWRTVTAAQAGEWLRSLSRRGLAPASLPRKPALPLPPPTAPLP